MTLPDPLFTPDSKLADIIVHLKHGETINSHDYPDIFPCDWGIRFNVNDSRFPDRGGMIPWTNISAIYAPDSWFVGEYTPFQQ